MDVKSRPAREITESKKSAAANYLQELKDELKKITWTTQPELRFCTKVVVGVIFVFGLGIYLADLLIKGVLLTFGSLFHVIFG